MEISLYSIFMAALTSTVLIVFLHFVYKIKGLNGRLGLSGVIALYVCSLLRLLLPFEFSSVNIEIKDAAVYPHIVRLIDYPVFEPYIKYQQQNCFSYMHVICIIIAIGAIVTLYRFAKKSKTFKRTVSLYPNLATRRERKLFRAVCGELGIEKNIDLIVIDERFSPLTYGFKAPVVLLPCNDFTDEELEFIFRHELTHIKNRDSLLKLLVEIYCCLFWWNPFVYLLRRDISQKLEIRCDRSTTFAFSENERKKYLYSIINAMKLRREKSDTANVALAKNPLVTSKFAARSSDKKVKERFSYLLEPPAKSGFSTLINILVFTACFAILISSYIFIIRPYGGDPPPEAIGEADALIDEHNSYLVKQPQGGYLLIFNDAPICSITEDEYNDGGYEPYTIVDDYAPSK